MVFPTPGVVDDAPLRLSPVSLPDDPRLEADLADDRRAAVDSAAGAFDPLGLYALEQERDEALDDLATNLPAGCSVRVARHAITQRFGGGAWETIDGWVVSATTADGGFTLSRQGARPLIAAGELLNAWRAFGPDDAGAVAAPSAAADRPRAA